MEIADSDSEDETEDDNYEIEEDEESDCEQTILENENKLLKYL